MTDADAQPFFSGPTLSTFIVFGIISMMVYFFFLKPMLAGHEYQQRQQQQQRQHSRRNNASNRSASTRYPTISNNDGLNTATNISTNNVIPFDRRNPPHVNDTSSQPIHSLLKHGMVAFRHTQAASFESKQQQQQDEDSNSCQVENRKERAKIMSKIMMRHSYLNNISSQKTFSRGAMVVVSIPQDDISCPSLSRILFLLATYFNLLVVVDVDRETITTDNHQTSIVETIQNSQYLNPIVLPSHRILAAYSLTGRVALCRQLGKVEFILDHDPKMKEELERFGFGVIVYGEGKKRSDSTSLLALEFGTR